MSQITNQDVVRLFRESGPAHTRNVLIAEIRKQSLDMPSVRSVEMSIDRTMHRYRLLSKSLGRESGQKAMEDWEKELYTIPKPKSAAHGTSLAVKEAKTGGNNSEETYKTVAANLAKELHTERMYNDMLNKENEDLTTRLEDHQSLKAKLQDSSEKLSKLERQTLSQVQMSKQVAHLESELSNKRKDLRAAKSRETYYREKVMKLEQQAVDTQLETEFQDDHLKLCEANKQLHEYEVELDLMKESAREASDPPTITALETMSKGAYNPCVQQCVFGLLENHVGSEKVPAVMSNVLQLAGVTPTKLPSKSTVSNMNIQRRAVAQQQLAEEVAPKENLTLMSDEMSKLGKKMEAFVAADSEGRPYVLGLRDILTKSGQDVLDCFKEILKDIDQATTHRVDETDSPSMSELLLSHIVATMSDRASTQTKLNELLEAYRAEVLPHVIRDFENLDEVSKQLNTRLLNFFCGLHLLVHLAEAAESALCEAEKAHFDPDLPPCSDPSFRKPAQAGTTRLVYTFCKMFARGADEKNGCHGRFVAYIEPFLKEHGYRSLPLQPYRGNRFNILFMDAGLVYFFQRNALKFLQAENLQNRLARAVKADLSVDMYMAGCRVLGLVSKLITSPLWNLIENKDINILDMNDKYLQLVTWLDDVAQDPSSFLQGHSVLVPDAELNKDAVFNTLIAENAENDHMCEIIIQILLPALVKCCRHILRDHLPGGIHTQPVADKARVAGTPKHNKLCETVFGYTDMLLRTRPHIQSLAAEAYVAFAFNKTGEWLAKKDEGEVAKILKAARKNVAPLRQKFRERSQAIMEGRRAKMLEDQAAVRAQLQRKEDNLQSLGLDIVKYGLWSTSAEVDQKLEALVTVKEKVAALKVQLQYRQRVMQMQADKDLFKFSAKTSGGREVYKWPQLAQNLKIILA